MAYLKCTILDPAVRHFLQSWTISGHCVMVFLVTTSNNEKSMRAFVDLLPGERFMTIFAPKVVKNEIFALILV